MNGVYVVLVVFMSFALIVSLAGVVYAFWELYKSLLPQRYCTSCGTKLTKVVEASATYDAYSGRPNPPKIFWRCKNEHCQLCDYTVVVE
jgi:hypothetical protein